MTHEFDSPVLNRLEHLLRRRPGMLSDLDRTRLPRWRDLTTLDGGHGPTRLGPESMGLRRLVSPDWLQSPTRCYALAAALALGAMSLLS